MNATTALSVVVGVTLGLGLWTLVALRPRFGAARLASRVARSIVDLSPDARDEVARRAAEPSSAILAAGGPWAQVAARAVVATIGSEASVAQRLRQAGSELQVADVRLRQLISGAAGTAAGVLVAVTLAHWSASAAPVLVVVALLGAALGLAAPEQVLRRRARSRRRRMAAELPTALEFLALSLSAGEGIRDALRRVARTGSGELAREFARAVAEMHAGAPLPDALARCATSIDLPPLTRTIDQLIGALERGSPLVDVLRAQAQDSRDDAKRELLEAAGRKEVAMLVPLVFGVLPVTIAFAVFPGLLVLQLGL